MSRDDLPLAMMPSKTPSSIPLSGIEPASVTGAGLHRRGREKSRLTRAKFIFSGGQINALWMPILRYRSGYRLRYHLITQALGIS